MRWPRFWTGHQPAFEKVTKQGYMTLRAGAVLPKVEATRSQAQSLPEKDAAKFIHASQLAD